MSRTAERIIWITVGAAIGAGVALLYAPKSGKDTRKFIRRRAEAARDAIADAGESVVDAGRNAYDTVVGASRDAYKKTAAAAAGAAQSAAGVFDYGRRIVNRGEEH